jgi:hypothetical protein
MGSALSAVAQVAMPRSENPVEVHPVDTRPGGFASCENFLYVR